MDVAVFMGKTVANSQTPMVLGMTDNFMAVSEFLASEMDDFDGGAADQSIPQLNDSEAGNIAFILSDRFSRNRDWNMGLDTEDIEPRIAKIADKVAKRLEELSLRLGDDHDANKLEDSGL